MFYKWNIKRLRLCNESSSYKCTQRIKQITLLLCRENGKCFFVRAACYLLLAVYYLYRVLADFSMVNDRCILFIDLLFQLHTDTPLTNAVFVEFFLCQGTMGIFFLKAKMSVSLLWKMWILYYDFFRERKPWICNIHNVFKPNSLPLFNSRAIESWKGRGREGSCFPRAHTPSDLHPAVRFYCMEIYPCKRENGTPDPHHNTILSWGQFSARHGLVKVPTKTLS